MTTAGSFIHTFTVDSSETIELVWTVRDGAGHIIERYTERRTIPPLSVRQARAPRPALGRSDARPELARE